MKDNTDAFFTRPFSQLLAGIFIILLSLSQTARADDNEFEEAEIFFELNNTDGDLGIHALIDGGPWTRIKIFDANERRLMIVRTLSRLRNQGMTEIFFESAEPTFDELRPARFFRRFPEGEYEVEGRGVDGQRLESETLVTHVMPAPPAPTVNMQPAAQQCDDEEDGFDITVTSAPVTLAWPEVTMSHPDPNGGGAGVQPPVPVEIYNYEVVVEAELEIAGEEFVSVLHVILPPGQTSFTIPDDFIAQSDSFKYEILAREVSYNQTATESCFELE